MRFQPLTQSLFALADLYEALGEMPELAFEEPVTTALNTLARRFARELDGRNLAFPSDFAERCDFLRQLANELEGVA